MQEAASKSGATLGNYRIYSGSAQELVEQVMKDLDAGKPAQTLACLNPHSFVVALDDRTFRTALLASDWLLPDGAGILWASKTLGMGLQRRISGPDMFERINAAANERPGTRVLLVGGPAETVNAVGDKLASEFPGLDIVGRITPRMTPVFNDEDVAMIAEASNAAGAEIIWLGLGAPKQERLAHRLAPAVRARFIGSVGAAFDFYSGCVQRSSPRMQSLGLEWLPRLLQNPSRLWRRTFVSAPLFMAHVAALAITRPQRSDDVTPRTS